MGRRIGEAPHGAMRHVGVAVSSKGRFICATVSIKAYSVVVVDLAETIQHDAWLQALSYIRIFESLFRKEGIIQRQKFAVRWLALISILRPRNGNYSSASRAKN